MRPGGAQQAPPNPYAQPYGQAPAPNTSVKPCSLCKNMMTVHYKPEEATLHKGKVECEVCDKQITKL